MSRFIRWLFCMCKFDIKRRVDIQCQTTAHFHFCANFSKNGYKRCLIPEKCCINLLISCRELVDKNPSAHTCLLLGDAYMSIQEVSEGCALLKASASEILKNDVYKIHLQVDSVIKSVTIFQCLHWRNGSTIIFQRSFFSHELTNKNNVVNNVISSKKTLSQTSPEERH